MLRPNKNNEILSFDKILRIFQSENGCWLGFPASVLFTQKKIKRLLKIRDNFRFALRKTEGIIFSGRKLGAHLLNLLPHWMLC